MKKHIILQSTVLREPARAPSPGWRRAAGIHICGHGSHVPGHGPLLPAVGRPGGRGGGGGACREIHVEIRYEAGEQQVLLNGENVTGQIRTDQVGNAASAISKYPAVRAALLELQRSLAAPTA